MSRSQTGEFLSRKIEEVTYGDVSVGGGSVVYAWQGLTKIDNSIFRAIF